MYNYKTRIFLIQQAKLVKFHVQPKILSAVFPGFSSSAFWECSFNCSSLGDCCGCTYYSHRKEKDQVVRNRGEKILIEVYRENERRLKYRAYSSPEWQELVKELRKRCLKQQVSCDQARKQCKGKLANLTKKYKTMNDNLRCDLWKRRKRSNNLL